MPSEIRMPQLGLTMESGVVVNWLVKEGDRVEVGQEILEIETDKSVVTVEAREAGTVSSIRVVEGEKAAVGAVLAILVEEDKLLPTDHLSSCRSPSHAPASDPELNTPMSAPAAMIDGGRQASWKARTLARQVGVSLQMVQGSGPAGAVVAADILSILPASTEGPPARPRAAPAAAMLADSPGLDSCGVVGHDARGQRAQADVMSAAVVPVPAGATPSYKPKPVRTQVVLTVPLAGVRGVVSERMAHSASTAARVTLFREVDVEALVDLRRQFEEAGLPVSYNDILVYMCSIGLREHPNANARLGDSQIEYLDRINIGLAVDTDHGLLVPVIRDADTLSISQIAAIRGRLVEDARAGRSLPDDLGGGTFTVTNLGMLGVESFTPIINLPESCILGVGRIVRKPVVLEGSDTMAVRPLMTLSLAFDHRVMDGAPAARFLDRIVQLIRAPLLALTAQRDRRYHE